MDPVKEPTSILATVTLQCCVPDNQNGKEKLNFQVINPLPKILDN